MFSLLNKKIIILERYLEGFFMENCEKIILDNIETLINICSKLTDLKVRDCFLLIMWIIKT